MPRPRVPRRHPPSGLADSPCAAADAAAPSSCKTSLMQSLAGVLPAPAGSVDVLGIDPARADARERARRIGFVFQNPEHQFIASTVGEELAQGLRLQGADDDAINTAVDRMLRRFGLDELREQHPFLLSGGQKRRLSVGTA